MVLPNSNIIIIIVYAFQLLNSFTVLAIESSIEIESIGTTKFKAEFAPTFINNTGICPDYYLDFNLISGEVCNQCELCGDGSKCAACPYPNNIPEGICPTYKNDQNVLVQGETCKDCESCGDGSTCVACTVINKTPTIPVNITGICPDYYLSFNLISGDVCNQCELCGDGSICTACPYPNNIPEGICPAYKNDQNILVIGETCKDCESCGDGSICVACTEDYSVEDTVYPTIEPTTTSLSSTLLPTKQNKTPSNSVCPDYYLNYIRIPSETCTECELCGDGSVCKACPDLTLTGVCRTYFDFTKNITVESEVCTGCNTCYDGSMCSVCSILFELTKHPSTTKPSIETKDNTKGLNSGFQVGIGISATFGLFLLGIGVYYTTKKEKSKVLSWAKRKDSTQTNSDFADSSSCDGMEMECSYDVLYQNSPRPENESDKNPIAENSSFSAR